jgi:hypothetical protein
VRAIADVATAVTKGDLTREIQGRCAWRSRRAQGQHQRDDPKPARHHGPEYGAGLAQDQPGEIHQHAAKGQRDLTTVGEMLLSELAPLVNAQCGAMYQMDSSTGRPYLAMLASYARAMSEKNARVSPSGDGLVGQCAIEKRPILLSDIPSDYVRITSSLGEGAAAEFDRSSGAYSRAKPKP